MGLWNIGFRMNRFLRDEKGTTFEGIALSVSIIAVGFVASADMLDYMTKPRAGNAASEMTAAAHQSPPLLAASKDTGLDYGPTASLPKLISRSVLDPCTGATK